MKKETLRQHLLVKSAYSKKNKPKEVEEIQYPKVTKTTIWKVGDSYDYTTVVTEEFIFNIMKDPKKFISYKYQNGNISRDYDYSYEKKNEKNPLTLK